MKRLLAFSLGMIAFFGTLHADDGQDFIEAVRKHDLAAVKARLAAGIDVNKIKDTSVEYMSLGETALIIASTLGHEDTVKLLLSRGADPNITNEGYSALRYAAGETGHLGIVKLLVEGGAQVDFPDPDGITALMTATDYERADIVRYLLEKGASK